MFSTMIWGINSQNGLPHWNTIHTASYPSLLVHLVPVRSCDHIWPSYWLVHATGQFLVLTCLWWRVCQPNECILGVIQKSSIVWLGLTTNSGYLWLNWYWHGIIQQEGINLFLHPMLVFCLQSECFIHQSRLCWCFVILACPSLVRWSRPFLNIMHILKFLLWSFWRITDK